MASSWSRRRGLHCSSVASWPLGFEGPELPRRRLRRDVRSFISPPPPTSVCPAHRSGCGAVTEWGGLGAVSPGRGVAESATTFSIPRDKTVNSIIFAECAPV